MKRKKMLAATFVFLVAALLLIYGMSAQTGDVSDGMSLSIARFFVSLLHPDFDHLDAAQRQALLWNANRIVRKVAHGLEYALLGAALALHLRLLLPRQKPRFPLALSLGLGIAYAALDEWHQMFVTGRTMQASDVLADAAGLLCGIAAVWRAANRMAAGQGGSDDRAHPG